MNPQTTTSASEQAMAGDGEHDYELRVARRGDAVADEATLRRVKCIQKLQERALFFQDEGGTRVVLERVTQSEHAMGCAVVGFGTAAGTLRSGPSLPKTCSLLQATSRHLSNLRNLEISRF